MYAYVIYAVYAYLCLHVYIHMYRYGVYICIHVYTHMCIYVYCTCICAYVYKHEVRRGYIDMCIYIYIFFLYTYVYRCMHACVCIFVLDVVYARAGVVKVVSSDCFMGSSAGLGSLLSSRFFVHLCSVARLSSPEFLFRSKVSFHVRCAD